MAAAPQREAEGTARIVVDDTVSHNATATSAPRNSDVRTDLASRP